MTRTTIYLPDHLHNSLKHLAVENRCSMTQLLIGAVETAYQEELLDLQAAQRAWRIHRKHPEKAVPARQYFSKRLKKRV